MSWLDELNKALKKESDPIPPGWWSAVKERKRLGISDTLMDMKIADALRLGILERKKFRVHNGKVFRRIYFYHKL